MGQYYTVSFAQQLEGADNYGNLTYSVKFQEETDSALWRVSPKTRVEPGIKVYGHIETPLGQKSGKPYRKFVREQEEGNEGGQQLPPVTGPRSPQPRYVANKPDDRSDGMRQGMCINNAASFVSQHADIESPSEWAETVHRYASALYVLGDLTATPEPSQTTEPQYSSVGSQVQAQPEDSLGNVDQEEQIDMTAIDAMFSGAKAVPANR